MTPVSLSIIIPCLDDGGCLPSLLDSLQPLRERGVELVLVDGGSEDGSMALAESHVDQCLQSLPGRGAQMNHGARASEGDWLWFLHADTELDVPVLAELPQLICGSGGHWGRFDIRLSGSRWLLRWVERLMNLRSRWTGIATGDQGIFVRRELFFLVGGYEELPLMEDLDLSRRLKQHAMPRCLRETLTTSSRRWERQGILRTILLMWVLRAAYALGVSPERLARWYRPCNSPMPES